MRVFLDANILFSAARTDGAIREILHLLFTQGHVMVADRYVVEEARRNLQAKASPQAVDDLHKLLQTVQVSPTQAPIDAGAGAELAWLPAKDQPVLASAMALRCDALLTGDRTHFGAGYGQSFGGVTLVSPAQLATQLIGDMT